MTSELRQQLTLAIPLAAQQVGFQLMGTVDAAWVGRYDENAIGAIGAGNNLLFAVTAIGLGIVMGLDAVIPRAVGAGRHDEARRYLHAGLRLAVLVGLVATLIVLVTPELLVLARAPAALVDDARVYVYLRAIGTVPFLASVALRSYLAAHQITRPLLVAVIAGNVINAVLDWALIFGVGGLPALGIAGAAIATLTVQLCIVGVYVVAVRALDRSRGWTAPAPSTRAHVREVAGYGWPIGGQLFAEVGIFGVATVLATNLGTLASAGHTIALQVSSFTFSIAVGVGAATSVRVGHAIGEGDVALARRRGLVGLATGVSVMGGLALVLLVARGPLARLFTNDADVVATAVPLLGIAALFQLSDGAQAVAAGALRGLGETRVTLVGNLLGHYAVGLPIALGLAYGAGLGARGLWWGLSAGLTVTALYLVARFIARTRTPAGSPR